MVKQYLSIRDDILSNTVHDEAGERIGKINDLLIDPEDNQPKIVILSDGGVLGIGSDYFALPFQLLRFNTHSSDVSLKVESQRIKDAPLVDMRKLKGNDKEEQDKLFRYYGVNALENRENESVDNQQYTQERQSDNPHEGYEGSAKTTNEAPESNPADDMDYDQLKRGKDK
ncbi:PRC-barrel domain-containing protein [Catalinimonas niigatensis]|uniref:PRC-barrel domain-containing protein n=1 Tax=Catalinimonas niigatensis TaxID=1397264 RepID=UPI002665005E|nr:PRC-barrel domain-containing protein [Catalinimonas niigatensis]WPP53450.1 PRC-barrel domain-containing protein [Catalinimonas niigatensis]